MLYVTLIVLLAPGASVPRVQGNAVVQSPVLETKVNPAGVGSVTLTLVALLGPSLVMVSAKVTFVPAKPLIGPVLLIFTSALETMIVGSLALLLPVFASPPPETLAVFVKLKAVDCVTVTGIVMLGKTAPAASTSDLEHETSWPLVVQVQPLPVAVPGVKPVGNVSVTVIGAIVAPSPLFATSSKYVPVVPRMKLPVWDFEIVKSGTRGVRLALAASSPILSLGALSGSGALEVVT
jgi:hypothetical protein